jgi:hypothetical protein
MTTTRGEKGAQRSAGPVRRCDVVADERFRHRTYVVAVNGGTGCQVVILGGVQHQGPARLVSVSLEPHAPYQKRLTGKASA